MTKKESHGESINRRKILSEERKDVTLIYRRFHEIDINRRRLAEISELLSAATVPVTDPLKKLEQEGNRAGLEIEQIWLKGKVHIISPAQSQHDASVKFNELEKEKPDVYHWLVDVKLDELSRAQKIHNSVFPPIRVAGFHTKR